MERLTTEQIADMKEYFSRSKEVKTSSLAMKLSHDGLKLIDTIEAQQQEIKLLNMEIAELRESNQALKDYAENADADKDEQAGRIMQQEMRIEYLIEHCEELEYLLRRTLPILEVANDQQELIEQINELLGGKEDVENAQT